MNQQLDSSLIKPAPYNPRKISESGFRYLKNSVEKFGDISGITWNKRTGRLITGHQRWTVLNEKFSDLYLEHLSEDRHRVMSLAHGYVGYIMRVVDWDEITEKAANVTANNNNIGGEFQIDILADLNAQLKEFDSELHQSLGLEELEKDLKLIDKMKEEKPPEDFDEHTSAIGVNRECPKCSYKWNDTKKRD